MRVVRVLGSGVVASLLLASAAWAGGRTVRLFGVAADSSGTETRVTRGAVGLRVQGGSAGGVGVGFEIQWKPRIGVDVDLMSGTAGYQARIVTAPAAVSVTSDPAYQVVSLGLHFDLASEGRVRLYVGPRLGMLRREGFQLAIDRAGGAREADESTSDLAVGVTLGADIGLGSGRWALHASLRYLEASEDESPLQLEPFLATFGVARRF